MITVDGIIYGGLTVVVGTVIVKYAYWLMNFTGAQDWIEDHIGAGTTTFVYKLFGILVVIGGILSITGLLHGVGAAISSPFKGFFPNSK